MVNCRILLSMLPFKISYRRPRYTSIHIKEIRYFTHFNWERQIKADCCIVCNTNRQTIRWWQIPNSPFTTSEVGDNKCSGVQQSFMERKSIFFFFSLWQLCGRVMRFSCNVQELRKFNQTPQEMNKIKQTQILCAMLNCEGRSHGKVGAFNLLSDGVVGSKYP